MQKKTVIITVIILLVAVIVAAAAYHISWPTEIDKTLTMTKLDAEGNELGTFQVHFKGKKLNYLLQESRVLLKIDSFDNIENIETSTVKDTDGKDLTGVISRFGQEHGKDYCQLLMEGFSPSSDDFKYVSMTLYFSGDFDRFAFHCLGYDVPLRDNSAKWSYVGSVSGDYTTEEIAEYFGGLIPG